MVARPHPVGQPHPVNQPFSLAAPGSFANVGCSGWLRSGVIDVASIQPLAFGASARIQRAVSQGGARELPGQDAACLRRVGSRLSNVSAILCVCG